MDARSLNLAEEKEKDMAGTPSSASTLHTPPHDNSSIENEGSLKAEPVEDAEEDEGEYPTRARLAFVVLALLLSIFLVALDMTIVATAIPKITEDFEGLDLVGWYGSAFFLTVGAFQSSWGKAYKYFPLKLTFLLAIFVFELGSLICAAAPNSTALIVGRAISGVGGAGISSGAYTIIAFSAPPRQRPAFTGFMGAAYGVASVIGPLLGGVFADHATWRWCFWINLPIGGLSAAIITFFFTTPPQAVPTKATWREKFLQMDLPGAFVVMAAIVCYILALQWAGQSKSWSDSSVIGTLVGFFVIVLLFIAVEWYQGERAMIVGRIMKDRTVYVNMVFIFFLGGGFFLLMYYLPIYFQVVSGVTASQSGIRNLPLIIGVVLATIISGGVISATGHFIPWIVVGSALATIGSGLLYTLSTTSSSGKWIGYQALAGLGVGAALQVPIIAGQGLSKPADIPSVTAMILFCQTIGGALFVSAGEVAFANVFKGRLPHYLPHLDPNQVIAVGVTQFRNMFSAEDVPGIINAYMDGLSANFAISIATMGLAFVATVFSKWQTLKGKVVVAGAA